MALFSQESVNKKMKRSHQSSETDKERNMNMNMDKISDLPRHVLDSILVQVPFKEVVQTSVLSKKWRHKWTSLSQFVIDDKCIPTSISDKVERWEVIKKIIRQVQSYHPGGIEKFKLSAYCHPDHSDLYQWLCFIATRGLKELILQEFDSAKRFRLPCCVFTSAQLNRLEFFGCMIKPSDAFTVFKCLTILQINQVCTTSRVLERIINNCPVLERLTLLHIDHAVVLRIHNPNLKYLKIDSNFDDINLENSPSLDSVDINLRTRVISHFFGTGVGNLTRVIGHLHAIQRLTLSSTALGFLANDNVPDRLPTLLHHLSVLELKEVRLDCMTEVMVCLNLFRSAPNLEKLFLSVASTTEYAKPVVEYLITQYVTNLHFHRLRVANIRAVRGVRTEWIFIKFILARSPMLERLTVVHYGSYERLPEGLFEQVKPASPHVKFCNLSL